MSSHLTRARGIVGNWFQVIRTNPCRQAGRVMPPRLLAATTWEPQADFSATVGLAATAVEALHFVTGGQHECGFAWQGRRRLVGGSHVRRMTRGEASIDGSSR